MGGIDGQDDCSGSDISRVSGLFRATFHIFFPDSKFSLLRISSNDIVAGFFFALSSR